MVFFKEDIIDYYEYHLKEDGGFERLGKEKVDNLVGKAKSKRFKSKKFVVELKHLSFDLDDLDDPEEFIFQNSKHFEDFSINCALGIAFLGTLFDFYYNTYGEIFNLVYFRLVLELSPPRNNLRLDLTDLHRATHDFSLNGATVLEDQKAELARKVSIYKKAFNVVLKNEEQLHKIHKENLLIENWGKVKAESNPQKKGELLENYIETLFSLVPNLDLLQKNKYNGDEEIDLIYDNTNQYLTPEKSPQIFIECKNWSSPVGTKEIRDFDSKMDNHDLAKLGLFISIEGFSEEVFDKFLLRLSRDDKNIILINGGDIESFLETPDEEAESWLRSQIHESTLS